MPRLLGLPEADDDPDGEPLERTGYCSRCGECCRPDPTDSGPVPQFTQAELDDPERVAGYCPLFRWRDGFGYCTGHGWHPFWYSGCDRHPATPMDLLLTPSCTFTFED